MREEFRGLNLYSKETYQDMWENAIIVLDTNILLNLFRYSKDTRDNVLSVLNSFKDRIWIPYQVIREYYKNRDKVIKDSTKQINDLEKFMNEKINEILEELERDSKKIQSIEELKTIMKDNQKTVREEINKLKKKNEDKALLNEENITTESALLDLIEDRYEEQYEYVSVEEVIKEGDRRIKEQIPPGYRDIDKSDRYKEYQINGDYLIFNSLITYAKENKKNLIFVTDDVKEDWFQEINGEKIGGRRELLQEFNQKTEQLLLIYSSEGFINNYNKSNPKSKITEETVKEIEIINRNNNWISLLEKGENIEEQRYYKFYNYNWELSNSEKIKCIRDIKNKISKIMMDTSYTDQKALYEVIKLVQKIEKYKIPRYEEVFKKIDVLIDKLQSSLEKERYYSFHRYLELIIDELEVIY